MFEHPIIQYNNNIDSFLSLVSNEKDNIIQDGIRNFVDANLSFVLRTIKNSDIGKASSTRERFANVVMIRSHLYQLEGARCAHISSVADKKEMSLDRYCHSLNWEGQDARNQIAFQPRKPLAINFRNLHDKDVLPDLARLENSLCIFSLALACYVWIR